MNYQDRIVCFLDILGFREHIAASVCSDGNDSVKKISELAAVFESIQRILDMDCPENRPDAEVTQFSDSVVISFPTYAESGVFDALFGVMLVQINLVLRGYLCRGGISRGQLIHTPTMLFGPAMIEAYTLESQAALYPRVILDVEIINAGVAAHACHHLPDHEQQSILSLLKRDLDGMYYINYITGAQSELDDSELDYPNYLFRLREIISSGILSRNPSVSIKYKWLREKLVDHLAEVKQSARNRPQGDEVRDAYERIPDL